MVLVGDGNDDVCLGSKNQGSAWVVTFGPPPSETPPFRQVVRFFSAPAGVQNESRSYSSLKDMYSVAPPSGDAVFAESGLGAAGTWSPEAEVQASLPDSRLEQYMTLDLGEVQNVTGVRVQKGFTVDDKWVTGLTVQTSNDGVTKDCMKGSAGADVTCPWIAPTKAETPTVAALVEAPGECQHAALATPNSEEWVDEANAECVERGGLSTYNSVYTLVECKDLLVKMAQEDSK